MMKHWPILGWLGAALCLLLVIGVGYVIFMRGPGAVAVVCALILGGLLGPIAGRVRRWRFERVITRLMRRRHAKTTNN